MRAETKTHFIDHFEGSNFAVVQLLEVGFKIMFSVLLCYLWGQQLTSVLKMVFV